MPAAQKSDASRGPVIRIHAGLTVEVAAVHGPDWFPLVIDAGRFHATLYLRRDELHQLRCRLDEIDDSMPSPMLAAAAAEAREAIKGGWPGDALDAATGDGRR